MSTDIIKYAFIAGEISPTLYGRGDLTKYDLGMAEAHNFFVDYRGGLSSRPGFAFCELVKEDDKATRMTRFAFSPDIENTYGVFFGHNYIRFFQDGAWVLEDAKTVTDVTKATPAVVTSAAHGFEDGDWVKPLVAGMTELNGRTFLVASKTANTFQLKDPLTGTDIDSSAYAAFTSGTISRIYEIASPFAADDLESLHFNQYRDYLRITSVDFPPHDLIRFDHTDWQVAPSDISTYVEGPEITGETHSATGDAQTLFAVSSVYPDGSESSIGNVFKVDGVVNYPVTEGSVSITWTPDPEAIEYKVYRSIVSVTEDLSYGSELGYAGRTRGTKFTDPNIIPDFGTAPQNNYNPFAPGAILSIQVTNGGSGYDAASAITMDGGGTGFDGQVIVDDSGAIVNVIIKNGGDGYVAPTVTFGTGTGATATVVARAVSGTYPALSCIFQQRQVYAASLNQPITLWGSQYKRFGNFNSSDYVLDSDAFEFDLDTAAIAPIKHLRVTRGGMLAMTQENVWLINGGGANEALTPTNALADPQTYTGVSDLDPIGVDSDVLYTEGKGYAVRMLSYNELSRIYSGEDKSILSNHLFGPGKTIQRWGYQESPFKTVWCVRSDGALLAFTIVKAEDVFAWTPGSTKGKFVDLLSLHEITEDRVYAVTQRYVAGRWTKMLERMDLRQFTNVEDAWCVDAGLSLGGTYPAASITFTFEDDEYYATASAAVFAGSFGRVLRGSEGIFDVAEVISTTRVRLTLRSEPNNWIPETGGTRSFPIEQGAWTLDTPVTVLSGLWHLEGETVSILGDGNVFPQQVVENGTITLPNAVTRAIIGLPYTCRAKTLPLIVPDAGIEAKRKRVVGVGVRLTKSRGLKYGAGYDHLYEMRERTDEAWGEPTRFQEGIRYQSIGSTWDEEGHTYFELSDPLPVTLLALVQDIEVGDDPD